MSARPESPTVDIAREQRAKDRAVKRARMLDLLDHVDAPAILLTSSTAVSWYLDGGRTGVSLAADPIVAVRVSRDADEVFLTSNETARLVAEELPNDVVLRERLWYEPMPTVDAIPEMAVADALRAARLPLLPGETDRYRALGADTAAAMTHVFMRAERSWSERDLAAALTGALADVGADPLVVLVGGAERAAVPHPLPTAAPLGSRAMAVLCARRDGLIANCSRWLAFGEETPEERDAAERILRVEAAALDATRPGNSIAAVLDVIASAYPAAGFSPDQWRRHHQGGAAGYAGRDPRATPSLADRIVLEQAFAWNPWSPGAKVEDTVLLTGTEEHPEIDVLTVDPAWPTTIVNGHRRPATLIR
ncbi:M24 family metallopeptidase [Curtobacterium ammoniigenes]|uniref:M24 family metallopeptidase n=1 Tax=Curtobacterium ammoniigenes TaxID=395387 RepID=UPI00082D7D35|nr:M24 family metallopeptidase [Curtobacterium ammoniigenes]